MPKTPRESFLATGTAKDFEKIVATVAFDLACDYALLELQSLMPPNLVPNLPTDPYIGLDANAQMTGAARVIRILKTLHEPVKPPTTPKRDTLHYGDRNP